MTPKIVVPLDGSPLAEAALPWAQTLARRGTTEVVLVSVIEMPTEFAAWITADQIREQAELAGMIDERRTYVEDAATRHDLESATIDIRFGAPIREILACVTEPGRSTPLILMSTHGYGGFKRLAFGSVALQIIHNYEGPIMTVRDETPVVKPRLERLLIPVDGSEFSSSAVERTLQLLGEPYPQLHLVRVLGTPNWALPAIEHGLVAEFLDASREWAQEQLDEQSGRATAAGYAVTAELRPRGNIIEEIIDAAESSGSDVIAMCTHGMGGMGRIVIGSVADGVLRHSMRPVLLLRPNTDE
jgi:nucleotide-binding universal stress UspA family protein